MKAEKLINEPDQPYYLYQPIPESLEWERVPNAPAFKQFQAAIGWLDPQKGGNLGDNWACVVGERVDGKYAIIEEFRGPEHAIGLEAVSMKDRYWIERIYIERGDDVRIRELRNIDGLTRYIEDGQSDWDGMTLYQHEPSHWPYYRGRHHIALLLSVPEAWITENGIGYCYQVMKRVDATGRLEALRGCTEAKWIGRQLPPHRELFRHPLCKAIVWTIAMMERQAGNLDGRTAKPQDGWWYQNL